MKNALKLFAVVLLAVQFVACSKPTDKLIGSWKTNGIEISNMDDMINKALELAAIPDTLADSLKTVLTDSIKANIETSMNAMKESYVNGAFVFNFKEDMTVEIAVEGQTEKGTWSLSEDGKKLILKGEGEQAADTMNIDENTDEKLVISGAQADMKMKVMFVKEKAAAAPAEEKK